MRVRWTNPSLSSWLLVACLAGACDGGAAGLDAATPDAAPGDAGARAPAEVGSDARPARLFSPPAHDGVTELPLVVVLHGQTVDATTQDLYFGLTRRARTGGFYVLLPDGTLNAAGVPHWDVLGNVVDDHAYLRGVIEEVLSVVPVDRGSVSLVGHSNGAFMAYRLACDSADLVTGIASLAGSDAVRGCAPSTDVSILNIHGTADSTVSYEAGSIEGLDHASATDTVQTWAERVGCDTSATTTGAPLDLVTDVDGAETVVTTYEAGCRAGVELWSMEGADHIPALTPEFTPAVLAWLFDHRR